MNSAAAAAREGRAFVMEADVSVVVPIRVSPYLRRQVLSREERAYDYKVEANALMDELGAIKARGFRCPGDEACYRHRLLRSCGLYALAIQLRGARHADPLPPHL